MRFPPHPAHENAPYRPAPPRLHISPADRHLLLSGRKRTHHIRWTTDEPPYAEGSSVLVVCESRALTRVLIGAQVTQYVGRVSLEDARAEGYKTRAEFCRAWINRTSDWARREQRTDLAVLAHFDQHYAPQLAWIIHLKLDRADDAKAIYLAPAGTGADYTTNVGRGMVDAGVVLDPPDRPAQTMRTEEQLRRELDALLRRGRKEILATGRAGHDTAAELEQLKRLIESASLKRRAA